MILAEPLFEGKPLVPFGIDLGGFDLDAVEGKNLSRFKRTIGHHGVAVIRKCSFTDAQFTAFLKRLGPLMFTKGETPVDGAPDLNLVTNQGRKRPPQSVFHTDTSYVSVPPAFTALRAVAVPEAGGETLFSNQYAAYRKLPAAAKYALRKARVRHEVTGVDPGLDQDHTATHPLFRRHPLTGRTALYLSTPDRCTDLKSEQTSEPARLISILYRCSTRRSNIYRHHWREGDLVIWDNRCTMHRADHSAVVGERTFHRGMVQGDRPAPAEV